MGPLKRVSGRHGQFLIPPEDIYVGRSLELYGQWCESEVQLFSQILRPGAAVVEVGANIGSHTVPLARLVGPEGHIIAVEVQPFVAQILSANLLLNGLTSALVMQAGVAAQPGALMVPSIRYDQAWNFGGISLDFLAQRQSPQATQVPVGRLDDMVRVPRLDLLKLDVEHLELEALQGAEGLIGAHHPVIYLENDDPDATGALLSFLHARGYRCYWHRSMLWDPDNHAGNPENVFGAQRCVNMLAVPQDRPVTGFEEAPDAASHPKLQGR